MARLGRQRSGSVATRKHATRSTLALIALGSLGSVFVAFAAPESPLPVKLAPVGLSIQADGATPEEVAELSAAAWDWFDRDTGAARLRVTRPFRLVVDLGESTPIDEIRFRGNDATRLSVERDDGAGGWATVPQWNSLDATTFTAGAWKKIPAGGHVQTRRISIAFTPRNTQSTTVGIAEVELWGPRPSRSHSSVTAISGSARSGLLGYPYLTVTPDRAMLEVQGAAGAQASFVIGRDARAFRRAYLVYDVQGATGGIGVQRSWNGLPKRGGFQRDAVQAGAWTEVIEEVDPAWLRAGSNLLDVRPSEGRTVRLRNLKLVLEVEDGRNDVDRIRHGETELSVLRDGDPATVWTVPAATDDPTVTIDLGRTVEIDSLTVTVPATGRGTAHWEAWVDEAWARVPTTGAINTTAWTPGRHTLAATGAVRTSRMRLRFETADAGLALAEVSLSASAAGARYGLPRIAIRSPERGEYWNDEAYLWGWVVPGVMDGQLATITVGGRSAPRDPDGAFARIVHRSEASAGATGAGPWEVKVEATLPDGRVVTRFVEFAENRGDAVPDDGPTGAVGTGPGEGSGSVGDAKGPDDRGTRGAGADQRPPKRASKKIKPAEGGEVSVGRCDVTIPPFALKEETEIVVETLEPDEVAGLGPALVNVTGPYAACRFLPHGNFDKPVRVRVPYELGHLPAGTPEDEIASFYYDEALLQWLPLKKVAVQKGRGVVLSETTHFTDVINGTLVLPDHPSPLSYNPNSIKDLKAASPAANIDLIEPPSGNQTGAANIGFPIRLPPGRGGAEPSLSVRYSSGGSNGPLGLGWSLSTSSISIDTRFGVPRYTGKETYTLDGSQLEPTSSARTVYRQRIEGAFLKIERKGTSVSTYHWEITSKDGSKAIYGQTAQARLASYKSTGEIFQWFLEKTIDPNGNTVDYHYTQDAPGASPNDEGGGKGNTPPSTDVGDVTIGDRLGGERWVAKYLQEVRYTGHVSGEAGRYSVRFLYDDGTRQDFVIDGRAGFKTLWRLRLATATVRFDSQQIRKYAFKYTTGAFQKSLLAAVAVQGTDGSEFYRHAFEYEGKPRAGGTFAPFAEAALFPGVPKTPPLNLTRNEFEARSLFLGAGPGPSRAGAIGVRVGRDKGVERGARQLMDFNGDGRPDYVSLDGVLLNDGSGFGNAIPVEQLAAGASHDRHLDRSVTRGMSLGYEAPYNVYSRNTSFTTNRARRIFLDADGDGLVDILTAGELLKNTTNLDTGTPALGPGTAPANLGAFAVADAETQDAINDRIFNVDPVVRWVAPFHGEVRIDGLVKRESSDFQHPTTVTASIWKGDTELWSRIFNPIFVQNGGIVTEATPAAEGGGPLVIDVEVGTTLYFRAHTKGDTRHTSLLWSPVVTYQEYCSDPADDSTCERQLDLTSTDTAGRRSFVFDRSSDFTLHGRGPEIHAPAEKGSLKVDGVVVKRRTTHPVTVEIRKLDIVGDEVESGPGDLLLARTFSPNQSGDFPVELVVPIQTDDRGRPTMVLSFDISSAGDLDDAALTWRPTVAYTEICRFEPPTGEEVCQQPSVLEAALGSFGDSPFGARVIPAGRTPPAWIPVVPQQSVFLPIAGKVQVSIDVPATAVKTTGDVLVLGINKRHFAGIVKQEEDEDDAPGTVVDTFFTIDVQAGDRLFLRTEARGLIGSGEKGSMTVTYVDTCPPEPEAEGEEGEEEDCPAAPSLPELENQVFRRPNPDEVHDDPKDPFLGGVHAWFTGAWNGNRDFVPRDFARVPAEGNGHASQPYGIQLGRSPGVAPVPDAWALIESARVERTRLVPGRAAADANDWFDGPDDLRIGESKTVGHQFGIPQIAGVGVSGTRTFSRLELMDFNGDRVPDVWTSGKVQLLSPVGTPVSDGELSLAEFPRIREGRGASLSISLGSNIANRELIRPSGAVAPPRPSASDRSADVSSSGPGVNASAAIGFGASLGLTQSIVDWIDVNGDGLPDAVERDPGTSTIKVRLNLGYTLGKQESWHAGAFLSELPVPTEYVNAIEQIVPGGNVSPDALRSDMTVSLTASISGSVSGPGGAYSGGGGLSATFAGSAVLVDLMDVHGDGLPDLVLKIPGEKFLRVKPNLGGKWGETEDWPLPTFFGGEVEQLRTRFESMAEGAGLEGIWPDKTNFDPFSLPDVLRFTGSLSHSQDLFATVSFPAFFSLWIFIGPGYSQGEGETGLDVTFQDLDGDGLVDHLFKLREVAFGFPAGEEVIRWKRNQVGPTNLLKKVVRPLGGSFAMQYERAPNTPRNPSAQWTLVQVDLADGFGEQYASRFAYANGRYDRTEREFFGFGTVITRDSVGREVEQTFDVSSYYRQGVLLASVVRGSTQALSLLQIPGSAIGQTGLPTWTRTEHTYEDRVLITDRAVFPQRVRTVTSFHEGANTPGKSLTEEFTYDELGNLKTYRELGEPGPADDVRASIDYLPANDRYQVGLPTRLAVTDGGGALLRERRARYDATGNLIELTSTVAGGASPTSKMVWDDRGNLQRFIDPVGYTIDYTYDGSVRTYVTAVQDSFGYRSTASHDLRFGLPDLNTDLNHEKTSYRYDAFGRTTAIFGPKEMGGPTPAFAMSYSLGTTSARPWALTRNKEDLQGGGTLDTLTVIDGLGRVVQVHTEAEVAQGSGGQKTYGAIVSGKVTYDGAGRITAQEQPAFVAGWPGAHVGASGGRPTHFLFDPLDRTTRVTLPDGSVTRSQYGFAESLHHTLVTDAENRQRGSLADIRGNVLAIDEFLSGQSIRTRYRYSSLSELQEVADAQGNRTRIAYDSLGRRTVFENPDRGRIDYTYDPAGNLLTLVDDNLRATGQRIEYRYDFSRLKEVVYPASAPVLYEYGAPNAPHRRAGRLAKITDESGSEERFYGALGELEKSTRTINSFQGPATSGTYTTEWRFDTFGRMREIIYPDGEVLTYAYDKGGRVVSAVGKKQGQTYRYLDDVSYDAFGSRVRLKLGNGVVTNYAYDPNRRWLTFLRTVNPQGEVLQALSYEFDRVGNILKLADSGMHPGVQTFSYDTLDRLRTAQGSAKLATGAESRYHNAFAYDAIHNLLTKAQLHEVVHPGGTTTPQQKTSYTLNVAYDSPKPHALTADGEKTYTHDPNGNLLGWQHTQNATQRQITWNEENRIKSIADNGRTTEFLYDAGGTRVVKSGQYGEVATVNTFFTARNAQVFTKHVFVGETRIASKVAKKGGGSLGVGVASSGRGSGRTTSRGSGGPVLASLDPGAAAAGAQVVPLSPPAGAQDQGNGNGQGGNRGQGNGNGGGNGNAQGNGNGQGQASQGQGDPWNGPHGEGCETATTHGGGKKLGLKDCDEEPPTSPPGNGGGNEPTGRTSGGAENRIFYYHPDHLGSTSYLTAPDGRIFERLAYFPFGETWIEEGNDQGGQLEFKFTGKELDPETGLYYFGERYFDPRTQQWSSPDSVLAISHFLVVPDPRDQSAFSYAHLNPLRNTDPTGGVVETLWDAGNIVLGVGTLGYNMWHGNWGDAAWDAGGLVVDVTATVVPFVPGGAAAILKAGRGAKTGLDVVGNAKTAENAIDAIKTAENATGSAKELPGIVQNAASKADAGNPKEVLHRFGEGPEVLDGPQGLAAQAAAAKEKLGVHGVSVQAIKGESKKVSRKAVREDVDSVFPVHKTGNKPGHRTVELPEPVKPSDVDKFNELFPPVKKTE